MQGPFLGPLDGTLLVSFPGIGNLLVQGIIQVGQGHQGLDGQEDGSDLKGWGPLVLENVQANSAKLVDVWVVDLGSEENLWWHHWILVWQEQLAVEDASLVWSFSWASNLNEEVSWVLLIWLGVNTNNWILSQSLGFLNFNNNLFQNLSSKYLP